MSPSLPGTLHHYFETGTSPFLSLSELEDAAFDEKMRELGASPIKVNRFDSLERRQFYRMYRHYTEQEIRKRFIAKGGQPQLVAPRYLTLGPVRWFYDWYEKADEISLSLDAIDPAQISFTYPDSMTSMLLAEELFPPYVTFKQPHHGQVFRLSELAELIAILGMPDEDDPRNHEFGNLVVEAQVWSLEPLVPFLEPG